ncbi:MAG TPA: antibiotic biosynthesis monooxygenase [Vicinamibacterales bacterium]|nr:antibiotic biosynthesis monooxygenase [Vicinamibacterales bacterium]
MISRQWRGIVRPDRAATYLEHLRTETFPQLSRMDGFLKASVLRRTVATGVEFLIVTEWESAKAIAQFAGADIDRAVVPENVRQMMIEYDDTVRHYEVVPVDA